MNPFLFRRIRGPVYLLCFALTALLAQWGILSWGQSWPIYLLAAGVLRLPESLVPAPLVPGVVPLRRSSLTGGLLLLAIGSIALLITTGGLPWSSFWSVYAVWWPLLLVALGVLLLFERVVDGRSARGLRTADGRYFVPRRRGGGFVFLVLLLIVLGLASRGPRIWWSHNWGPDPDWKWSGDWFSDDGNAHENDVAFDKEVAPDATLTIENARGELEVTPSIDGRVHVQAHETAHVAAGQQGRVFAAVKPVWSSQGGAATLRVPEHRGAEVRLTVAVPPGIPCTLRNHHGDLAVSGLQRALTIEQDHGTVALDSLGGPAHLRMDHGDVHARSLAGDLAIEGRADDITLAGIRGKATLNGSFFGDTEIDGTGAPVVFHSNRTDLDLAHLAGSLSLDGEKLHIAGANGGLQLTTRSKDIEITGLSGEASITDSNSDIAVTSAEPLGALSLTDNTGNITASVPPHAGFRVQGGTSASGRINSEFPFAQTTEGDRKVIIGENGHGGPLLRIETTHGDITLRVASPEMPERRLRAQGEPPAPVVQ